MSLPSFPSISPPITREDALNQLIASIASEELGMSHILNAEGEKLQYILGTLPGLSGGPATYQEVLDANDSVSDLLNSSMELTFLLKNKLDLAMNAPSQVFSPDITVSGANSIFTVANAGTYRLSYSVNTTLALLLGTRLLVNGSPLAGSIISPLVSLSNYNNEVEVNLTAGSTISLQFVNTTILPVLVTLISGVGASLMIIRLN